MKRGNHCQFEKCIKNFLSLPLLGQISNLIGNEIKKILIKDYFHILFEFIFLNKKPIGSLFRYKDSLPEGLISGSVYKYFM